MNLLQKSPLLIWVLCFMLGLILGIYDEFWVNSSIAFIVVVCGIFLFTAKRDLFIRWFFGFSFVGLGIAQMQTVFPSDNVRLNGAGKVYFVAEIQDQLRKGVVWETNIAKIESAKINGVWERIHERVLLICQSSSQFLKKGDKIIVYTEIQDIRNKGNPGEFDSKYYWKSKGIRYQCFGAIENYYILHPEQLSAFQQLLVDVRNYSIEVIDKHIGGEEGDLMKAILLGDKSDLEQETKISFINTGAMHVLAVSGMHVVLIAYLLNAMLKFLFRGRFKILSVVLLLTILWFYAFLTGFSASVSRAVFMFTVLILSQLMNRQHNSLNSLAFAALIILLWNPINLFDIGFQLSFLAMVGIFTFYISIEQLFYVRNKYLLKLWQGTAVGLAAQVFTVPVSLYYFYQFPNYFMLSNVGVMLLSGLILGIGIALLALGKVPYVAMGIGWISALSVGALLLTIQLVDSLPGAVAYGFNPSLYWVFGMYLLIVLVIGYRKKISLFWVAVLFLPGLFWLQFNRFQNLKLDEICIFNAGQVAVMVNRGGDQKCFYSGNEVAYENAVRLANDYQRVHPGKVTFYKLNFKKFDLTTNKRKLAISWYENHIEMKLKNEIIHFVHCQKYQEPKKSKDILLVAASYLNVYPDAKHNLMQGAYRCAIP